MQMRVATAQYRVECHNSWLSYKAKLEKWIAAAAEKNAELLVFPEYAAMELVALFERRYRERRSPARHTLGPLPTVTGERRQTECLDREAAVFQCILGDYIELNCALAKKHNVYILAGSLPVRQISGRFRNTAYFFDPSGQVGLQEKLILTRWESEVWGLEAGDEVRIFDTAKCKIGIAICYDIEFPHIARSQAEAGAKIILSPCCTESERGYHRVRIGAQARALENQAYVIQSSARGYAPWSGALNKCEGLAGVFAPPDIGEHVDGTIAQGKFDSDGWIFADLDLNTLARIRGETGLANRDQWGVQLAHNSAREAEFRAFCKDPVTC